ncbi:hypothetical protein AVEN_67653-1 [Araneus ventricosus]|uniref:Uncharacterized protein n=1 Tax=Araneus ventricosus TaxID=182803 RepID=A0A4Y2SVY2_ARAVE|nr:hypothetical protein AVEN_67653-1 [Araneus ventricosus]
MSRPTCLNKANEKEVDERLCDIAARPLPEIKECNSHKCPPVESRFPAMLVLWFGREFYKVKHGVTAAAVSGPLTSATNR